VVAEGSKSRLREVFFPKERLRFANVSMIAGAAEIPEKNFPAQFLYRHGAVASDDTAIFVAHEADNRLMWAFSWLTSEPHDSIRYRTSTPSQFEALKKEVLEKSKHFPDSFREMVLSTPSFRVLNLYDKMPHPSVGAVAWIGDSTHPVTPFSGNGANMALVDAVKLAEVLTSDKYTNLIDAIQAYDKEMIPRTRAVVTQGRRTIDLLHASGKIKKFFRNILFRVIGFSFRHMGLWKRAGLVGWCVLIVCIAVLIEYLFRPTSYLMNHYGGLLSRVKYNKNIEI